MNCRKKQEESLLCGALKKRYENKSMKEIAESLNVTVKGVDYHIGKALQALRKNLKDYLYTLLFF